jgi:hypothetical protein
MSKSLTAVRHKLADYERNVWVANTEAGVSLDEIRKPEFFAHVAAKLKPWDRIEVRPDDETFYAELLVRSAGKNWAVTTLIQFTDLAPKEEQAKPQEGYRTEFGGPHHKWRVLRLSDKEVVSKGHTDQASADAWLVEHMKAMKV